MNAFFENFIHAAGVDIKARSDAVLELAIPMAEPNLNSIVEGQLAAWGLIVVHSKNFRFKRPLETETGKCDSETVRVQISAFPVTPPSGLGLVR